MNSMIKNINVFRNSTWKTWAVWAENITLLFIMSITFYIMLPVNTHFSHESKISIPKGATSKTIIAHLTNIGYDVGNLDTYILSYMGKIRRGNVSFKTSSLSRLDFLYSLTQAKIPLFRITLIPGETKKIFFDIVAEKLDVNSSKLMAAYKTQAKYPEAAISADTYLAPKNMNESNLIKFLLSSSERKYKKHSTKEYGDYNQSTWHRILTIASIIQKEAASREEMPLISSVIYNRLKINMRLQMDGTLNYGKYSHIKVTPQRIKTDLSSFNTYKYKGLPHSPIGAVSSHAINAAIHPAKTKYLYFMRNKHGVHDFADTFKKHRKNIKNIKKAH